MKTPILVGAGQFCQREIDEKNLGSAVDLGALAAKAAMQDTGVGDKLASHIDTIAWVRTFADSGPIFQSRLGKIEKPPLSLAKRIDARPKRAIHNVVGGNTPQSLVHEFATAIANGETDVFLMAGGEAAANEAYANKNKLSPDWAEDVEGEMEERGLGLDGIATGHELMHFLFNSMPLAYSLFENSIRHHMGNDLAGHMEHMSKLMEPFIEVARNNPYSMFTEFPDHAEMTARDALVTTTYHKGFCAREKVNQAAAVIMTSTDKARELGIPEDKWVYLHDGVDVMENTVTQRKNFHSSDAIKLGADYLFSSKDISLGDIAYFDLYSCFPSAVEVAMDALGIEQDDPRPLTLTGGLPYFGGPGNNYSMHGIAEMMHTLRKDPGAYGLVLANGGALSKQALGIYSTNAPGKPWTPLDKPYLKPEVDPDTPAFTESPEGELTIETYGVLYSRGTPTTGVVIGVLTQTGERCLGLVHKENIETFKALEADDIIGKTGTVSSSKGRNFFTF